MRLKTGSLFERVEAAGAGESGGKRQRGDARHLTEMLQHNSTGRPIRPPEEGSQSGGNNCINTGF